MRHSIGHIDYHVVDACNLACEFCTHYSNFKGPANIMSVDAIEAEWGKWSNVIRPERIHIIGGEPLLNPNIVEIVRLAFRIWTESEICLYSNGLLLKNHPGIKGALRGGRYVLGLHYCDERDRETEEQVRQFFFDSGVKVDVVDGALGWFQFYKFDTDENPVPYNDGDPRASWSNCIAAQQGCLVMRHGRLWKCPQVAFADRAGVDHWFEGYESCLPSDDVAKWLAKEDEPCCGRCPSTQQFTPHGAGHMKSRKSLVQIAIESKKA